MYWVDFAAFEPRLHVFGTQRFRCPTCRWAKRRAGAFSREILSPNAILSLWLLVSLYTCNPRSPIKVMHPSICPSIHPSKPACLSACWLTHCQPVCLSVWLAGCLCVLYVSKYVCMYASMHVCMCVCMYACMCGCMHGCHM